MSSLQINQLKIERTMYKLSFLLVILVFPFNSCQNSTNQIIENKTFDTTDNYFPELDKSATIFTIPSPMQIATTLKIIDLPYKSDFISLSSEAKNISSSKYYQSLNLGVNIIDLGYVVLYDKNYLSTIFLSKIENLTNELGLQDQNTINKISRIKDNLYNKDSISHFILSAQNSITNFYQNSSEEEVGIWIISSLYLEGLYILVDNYNTLIKSGEISELQVRHLNILLLHQKLFLPNLCELYNVLEINNKVSVYKHLEGLQKDFDELNITFKYDEEQLKLKDVKLDNKKISNLYRKLSIIRNDILSCNLK